jgi:branched-subunit amino acid transport protein
LAEAGGEAGTDRLILLTRAGFLPLAVLTAIFGPALLLFPGSTADYWSWQIRPDMSAVWVGAGYSFGAMAITTMLAVGRWRSAIVPILATFPFALAMAAATLIHLDRFFQDSPRVWVWAFVYVGLPVALPAMYFWNRSEDPGASPADLLFSPRLRGLLAVGGAGVFVLGLWLFLDPSGARTAWPWLLTPLMSRVIGGWLMFIGTGGFCAAFEARYVAYRYFLPLFCAWFAILLVASLLNFSDFDKDRLSTPLYFAGLVAVIAFVIGITLRMERKWRAEPAPQTAVS